MLKHFLSNGAIKKLPILIAACALLNACDSNDDNNRSNNTSSVFTSVSSVPAKDVNVTNVHFQYPPNNSTTAEDTVTLRGAVLDTSNIGQVLINGNLVSSEDSYATWQYELPLTEGENVAVLSYQTTEGAELEVSSLSVFHAVDIIAPRHILGADAYTYIYDAAVQGIIRVDTNTGQRTLLSPQLPGTEDITDVRAIALNLAQNRIIYAKQLSNSSSSSSSSATNSSAPSNQSTATPLYLVDISSGEQSTLQPTPVSGRALSRGASALLVDGDELYASYDELVFVDDDGQVLPPGSSDATRTLVQSFICKIDPSTGERTLFSGYGNPSTTSAGGSIFAMASSTDSDTIYALEIAYSGSTGQPYYRIATIKKDTGERDILESFFLEVDPDIIAQHLPELADQQSATFDIPLENPVSLKLDPNNNRLILLNNSHIVAYDLETERAQIVLAEDYQPGPILISADLSNVSSSSSSSVAPLDYRFKNPVSIELDTNNNQVLSIDDSFDRIVASSLETGERSFFAGTGAEDPQNNLSFQYISGIHIDEETNTLFVADRLSREALMTEIGQLDKTPVMKTYYPELPTLPVDVEFGRTSNALYLVDNFNQKPDAPRSLSRFNPRLFRLSASEEDNTEYGKIEVVYAFNSSTIAIKNIEVSYDEKTFFALYHLSSSPEQVRNFQGILKISLTEDGTVAGTLPRKRQSSGDVLYAALRDMALMEAEGKLVGVDSNLNAVFTIDINTGQQILVSGFDSSKDINLVNPVAVVPYENNSSVLVLDASLDAVIKINLESDEREIVVDNVSHSYDNFSNPKTMDLHETFDYLLIGDDTRDALIAVDLKTKEKVRYLR